MRRRSQVGCSVVKRRKPETFQKPDVLPFCPPHPPKNKTKTKQTHNKLILFIFSFVRLVRSFALVSGGQSGRGSGLLSQSLLGQKFTPRGGDGAGEGGMTWLQKQVTHLEKADDTWCAVQTPHVHKVHQELVLFCLFYQMRHTVNQCNRCEMIVNDVGLDMEQTQVGFCHLRAGCFVHLLICLLS